MNNICKLCVHSDIDVKAHPCNDCGDDFSMFKSGIKQQLAQAHRQGWEQCQREAVNTCHNHRSDYGIGGEYIADGIGRAIASMEYKGEANGV